eukprot:5172925-Pleurochrysis_carterae.AAC.1
MVIFVLRWLSTATGDLCTKRVPTRTRTPALASAQQLEHFACLPFGNVTSASSSASRRITSTILHPRPVCTESVANFVAQVSQSLRRQSRRISPIAIRECGATAVQSAFSETALKAPAARERIESVQQRSFQRCDRLFEQTAISACCDARLRWPVKQRATKRAGARETTRQARA